MSLFQFLLDEANWGQSNGRTFTRDAVTVSPALESCGTDIPRFDLMTMIAPVPAPADVEHVYNNTQGRLMAAGVDADGTTELMVYLNRDGDQGQGLALWVFVDGDIPGVTANPPPWRLPLSSEPPHVRYPLNRTPALTRIDPVERGLHPTTFDDLFTDDDRPTFEGNPVGFHPVDAVVFHGVIVLAGSVYVKKLAPTGVLAWGQFGFGFALSLDRGETWSLVYHDLNDPSSTSLPYWPRGNTWVMKVAGLYESRGSALPPACYVSCVDYKNNLGNTVPGNGNAYVLRFVRDVEEDPVGPWTGPAVVRFNVPKNGHTHVAQVTEYQPGESEGLQLVVSSGDGDTRNRFTRYTLDDRNDPDFTEAEVWTTQDDYHGTHDGQHPQAHGAASQQPRSALQGPEAGTIFWGADGHADLITLLTLPDDSGQCSSQHMYGFMTGWGRGFDVPIGTTGFYYGTVDLEDIRPENNGQEGKHAPAIGWISNEFARADEGPFGTRIIYSPHVSADTGGWVQLGTMLPYSGPSTMVYGDFVYMAVEWDGGPGLHRKPVPSVEDVLRRRPMLVACGGENLIHKDFDRVYNEFNFPEHGVSEAIAETSPGSGEFSVDGRTLQPPCLCDKIFKVTSDFESKFSYCGDFRISEQGEEGISWSLARQIRRVRMWITDGSFELLSPNKTAQLSTTLVPDGPEVLRHNSWTRVTCGCGPEGQDRWCPTTLISYNDVAVSSIANVPTLAMQLFGSASASLGVTDTNNLYVAFDQALDGPGACAYPLAPTDGSTPSSQPDEHLTVSGLGLPKNGNWIVRVVGMVPVGNWDQYAMRGRRSPINPTQYESDKRWPLLTIWGDVDNYVELLADCESRGLCVRAKVDGSSREIKVAPGTALWLPESPGYFVVAYDAAADALHVGFSLGGDLVHVATLPSVVFTVSSTLDELHFRGANGEVCEFRWFGGDADNDPEGTPSAESIKSAFVDLVFLDPPPP